MAGAARRSRPPAAAIVFRGRRARSGRGVRAGRSRTCEAGLVTHGASSAGTSCSVAPSELVGAAGCRDLPSRGVGHGPRRRYPRRRRCRSRRPACAGCAPPARSAAWCARRASSRRDFVYPMFVAHGLDRREPIEAMPGHRPPVDRPRGRRGRRGRRRSGSRPCCCSGCPAAKDEEGSGAWDDEGIVQLATRAIKEAHPELLVITDLCLCEYTSHGHCGVVRAGRRASTTTPRSSCSPAPRSPRPAPAPTWSRPAT